MDTSIFSRKSLMITGGTGTLGNALVDSALETDFGELRSFLAATKRSRRRCAGRVKGRPDSFLGDVRNYNSVSQAMPRGGFGGPCRRPEAGSLRRRLHAGGNLDQYPGRRERPGGRTCSRRRQGDCAQHRQGRLSDQRDGNVQGADGEMHGGQGAHVRRRTPRSFAEPAMAT